jgi:hypothetical protein
MAVNSMTFKQSATLLNSVLAQMGGASLTATNEAEFVSVASTALQAGYDQLNKAISQVLTKSIYSSRAYSPIYPSLERDTAIWGGIVRKVTILDLDLMDDAAFSLTDGQTGPDPFLVNKQKAVQFNFYGGNVKELVVTTTEDQLRQAFSSSADFGSFMAAQAQNLVNQLNQKIEAESRITVNNMIAAAITADSNERVIHLLTEYKAATGNATITAANYLSAAEFEPFAKWMYGRLNTLKRFMAERTSMFHANITSYNGAALSKSIMRHTPEEYMNIYMLSEFMDQVDSSALSGIYNEEILQIGNFERVNYWQSIKAPDSINVVANVLQADGSCAATEAAVEANGIVGVLFDYEACGITLIDEGVRSIENPRGRYFNNWYNWTSRWFNDQTENFVVLQLD